MTANQADPPKLRSCTDSVLSEPKQERSQRTLNRILDAAEQLIDGRDFSDITVQEISRKAGTSVSSFYARFSDKSALLHTLLDRFAEEMREHLVTFRESLDPEASLEDLVAAVIGSYMDIWQQRRGLILTLTLAERSDHALFERRRALDDEVLAAFRDACLEIKPELRERGFGRAFEVAMPALSGAVRSAVERPDLFGGRPLHSREALIRELTELGLQYVKANDPT